MEEIKEKVNEIPKVVTEVKSLQSKKFLYLLPLAIVMLALVILGYFWGRKESHDDLLTFIDNILLSNENNLNNTDNIDTELLDLPEDFLESEVVQEEVVDIALEELDEELKKLSSLESDFSLDTSDVGL